jgi:hypothetical protein
VRFEKGQLRSLGAMLTHEYYAPDVCCLPADVAPWRRSAQLWWQHSESQATWRYRQ